MLTECHCGCHTGDMLHTLPCCKTCEGCNVRFIDNAAYRMHSRICPLDPKQLVRDYNDAMKAWQPTAPTGMLLGRFQPFHAGHVELAEQAIAKVGQVAILMRHTELDVNNPFAPEQRSIFIHAKMQKHLGKYLVALVPNFTHVFYGRDVGYTIEQLDTGILTQVSATAIRRDVLGPVQ